MLDVKKTIALGKQWCLIKMMRSKKKREREFSFLLCVCSHFGVGVNFIIVWGRVRPYFLFVRGNFKFFRG